MTTSALDLPEFTTSDGVFGRSARLTDRPHEQVVFHHDAATGLRAIVAIHSTALGPALGGTRFYPTRTRCRHSRTCCDCRGA